MKVADVGCGIGGPLVTFAKASGASITGINYNAAQLHRCEKGLRQAELNDTCDLIYADFMGVPREDATFDAIYSIEAACHAPNRQLFWHEMCRLLNSAAKSRYRYGE